MKSLETHEINSAIRECSEKGGGIITIPAGTHKVGSIRLMSNVTLNLEPGSVLQFVPDKDKYPLIESRWEGIEGKVYASCIYAENCENIAVTGRGTLDGNGEYWWSKLRNKTLEFPRPKLINFMNCKNVLISGIKLINSPSWTVNPVCCNNVTVTGITINNPADSPNTDGVNPESCQNVHISDCHIDVGDDCVTIKSGTEDTFEKIPCENVTVTNCTMVHGHGGVVIGSEMSGGIHNVVISNCVFDGTDRGIRIKSRRGRGGEVSDIRVNNIVMRDVMCPFVMNMYYFCGARGKEKYVWDKDAYPVDERTPSFKRIYIDNVTAVNVHACAGYFYGLPEMNLEDISLSNISVHMAQDAKPGVPIMADGIGEMVKKGFIVKNAKDTYFHNVHVKNCDGKEIEEE